MGYVTAERRSKHRSDTKPWRKYPQPRSSFDDMHAFVEDTVYPDDPASIPSSHIALLDDFFRIVDSLKSNPGESQRFIDIFAPDGVWKTPSAAFRGKELLTSGSEWSFFKEIASMRHYVLRVYTNDRVGKEMMLHGRIEVEVPQGDTIEVDFGARVEIEGVADDHSDGVKPKLKFFQGWSARV